MKVFVGFIIAGLLGFGIGCLVLIFIQQTGNIASWPIVVLVASTLITEALFFWLLTRRRIPR